MGNQDRFWARGLATLLFSVALGAVGAPAAAADSAAVVINELFYDAVGDDGDQEWVEIFNQSADPVDLSGWRLERGGTAFANAFTFPAGAVIVPGEFLLVGEPAVPDARYRADLNFQNGGEASDGARLVNGEERVIDVVLYDSPNTSNLPDESGSPGTSFAPDVSAGHSLARVPDGADTNASAADFLDAATPTPGAPNTAAATSSPTPGGSPPPEFGGLVVTEVLPNPTGDDAAGEFIELHNAGGSSVNLGGAQLDDAEGGSAAYTMPSGTMLAPGAYRAFSRGDTKLALNNEGDSARLLAQDGSVVSSLTYPKVPREGVAWARQSDGTATWTATVTPGAANVFTPLSGDEKVEVSPTPRASPKAGASASPTAGRSTASPAAARIAGTATGRSSPPAVSPPATPRARISERTIRNAAEETATAPAETASPASPSVAPTPSPAGNPKPKRWSVSAILAWGLAGALGLIHLVRRTRHRSAPESGEKADNAPRPSGGSL